MRLKRCLLISVLLILSIGACSLYSQTKQVIAWKNDLAVLQSIPAAELEAQRDVVSQIRTGVEFWLKLHPSTTIQLEPAPPQPWNPEQIKKQISQLRNAVEAILKEDPKRSFELGVTVISVTAETSPLAPITDSVDHQEIEDLHLTSVTQIIQNLPGVSVDHKSGRNQSGVMIRGFDTRQVGLYLDNVPILVPYDGYADISRLLSSDISVIEVAKGYSSPLIGPNGLGGVVNLVTRQPEKKIEGDTILGTGSGNMLESGAHIGSKWDKFFVRGGMDWLQSEYFPLSNDFVPVPAQGKFYRANSDQRDVRYNGRIGWTPRGEDQYVFTYNKQKADYGAPPYAGSDTRNNRVRYWRWGYWDRESYYLNTNTGLGESNSIKFRGFYDEYPNRLDMFSNATLTSQLGQGSSKYDDSSKGFSSEFTSRMLPRHTLGVSFFLKDDIHKERSTSISNRGVVTIEPWRNDRDQLTSIGIQDTITLSSRLRATVGFSADHLNAIRAQDINKTTNTIVPFTCENGAVGKACLLKVWAYNPLASISYSVAKSGTLFFTFAMKSRFPTLKDRYSYKNGQAVPNPTLQPEYARNYALGYSHAFNFKTMMQVELFRSDVYDAIQNATIPAEFPNQCPTMPSGICRKAVNIGKEVHQGAEFTVRSTPLSRLTIDANYSFLQRTLTGPSNMLGVFPTGTPRHKTVGTASLRLPWEVRLLASARYESGTITSNDSGLIIPASRFATADLGGIVNIKGIASLQLGIKNLFDRNYYYQEGFPESGRTWYFNTRYRF